MLIPKATMYDFNHMIEWQKKNYMWQLWLVDENPQQTLIWMRLRLSWDEVIINDSATWIKQKSKPCSHSDSSFYYLLKSTTSDYCLYQQVLCPTQICSKYA